MSTAKQRRPELWMPEQARHDEAGTERVPVQMTVYAGVVPRPHPGVGVSVATGRNSPGFRPREVWLDWLRRVIGQGGSVELHQHPEEFLR